MPAVDGDAMLPGPEAREVVVGDRGLGLIGRVVVAVAVDRDVLAHLQEDQNPDEPRRRHQPSVVGPPA